MFMAAMTNQFLSGDPCINLSAMAVRKGHVNTSLFPQQKIHGFPKDARKTASLTVDKTNRSWPLTPIIWLNPSIQDLSEGWSKVGHDCWGLVPIKLFTQTVDKQPFSGRSLPTSTVRRCTEKYNQGGRGGCMRKSDDFCGQGNAQS